MKNVTVNNVATMTVGVPFREDKKPLTGKDKREKYYKFTKQGKKILQEWVEGQKKVFSNLNELNFE